MKGTLWALKNTKRGSIVVIIDHSRDPEPGEIAAGNANADIHMRLFIEQWYFVVSWMLTMRVYHGAV